MSKKILVAGATGFVGAAVALHLAAAATTLDARLQSGAGLGT